MNSNSFLRCVTLLIVFTGLLTCAQLSQAQTFKEDQVWNLRCTQTKPKPKTLDGQIAVGKMTYSDDFESDFDAVLSFDGQDLPGTIVDQSDFGVMEMTFTKGISTWHSRFTGNGAPIGGGYTYVTPQNVSTLGAFSASVVVVPPGLKKDPSPGSGTQDDVTENLSCSLKVHASLTPRTGNGKIKITDPVSTRGYALTDNIYLNTQVVEANRAMGSATFTYDIHLATDPVYDAQGRMTLHRRVVDGDGTRLEFGRDGGDLAPGAGIFSQLAVTPNGYELRQAGPPESLRLAGNFTYRFNKQGLLLYIVDPAGNRQDLTYDVSSHLLWVVDDSTNRRIDFEYTGDRISRLVENGGGAIISLTYGNGLLTGVTTSNAQAGAAYSVAFTYDASGVLQSLIRDGEPKTTITFHYTAWQSFIPNTPVLLANAEDVLRFTKIEWGHTPPADATERVVSTNVKGGTTLYDFAANGDLLRVTTPTLTGAGQPTVSTFAYDANHQVTLASDGVTTEQMEYAANGLLTRYVDGAGHAWHYTYNGVDMTDVSDEVGLLAHLEYGDFLQPHLPTAISDGAGHTWRFQYNAYGQTIAAIPPPGSPQGRTFLQYEENPLSLAYGYPRLLTDGNNDTVSFDSYTLLGDVLQQSTYPVQGDVTSRNSAQFAFDAARRLTGLRRSDGSTFAWDYAGRNLGSTTDEAGTRQGYTFCPACDLLLGTTGPLGWSLNRKLDGDRDVTAFIDARGKTTEYSYGPAGELKSLLYPDKTGLSYLYDRAGRVRQITNGRGQAQTLQYDAAGRPQKMAFPTTGLPAIQVEYFADSTVKTVQDAVGTTSYTYTPNRQVESVTYDYRLSGLPTVQRLDYAYNPDNSLTSLTWSNGSNVVGQWNYFYNRKGLLEQVANTFGETTQYSFDGEGKLKTQLNANGTACAYTYNEARGWPTQMLYTRGGVPFAGYQMAYDNGANTVGNLTGARELDGSQALYGYDPLYRLTSETRQGTGAYSRLNDYDLAGNLTKVNGATFASYDDANKIASVSGGSAFSDADGNLTSITGPGIPSSRFFWDDRSKLVRQSKGVVTVGYGYGADGKRVWSQVGSGAKTFYIFNGDLLLGEVKAGGPSAAYTWGANGLVSERLLGTGKSLWYDFGPQGETRHLTDANGAIVDSYLYNAYGVILAATNNNPNPFRYGGKFGYFTDSASQTGTILCGQRWYNPSFARWLSRDPIAYDGGDNLYGYVDGDPMGDKDPSGLSSLIYDNESHDLRLIDSSGREVGAWDANNNPASGYGQFPAGTYDFSQYNRHPESNINGSFGENGIYVFDVPGHSGLGVHAGRFNRGGPHARTHGCIRTNEAAMSRIRQVTRGYEDNNHVMSVAPDPITDITVIRFPGIDPSGRNQSRLR